MKLHFSISLFCISMVLCVQSAQSFIDDSTVSEKYLVVIVPSYNNAQWYKHNLDSIFMQKYPKNRVRIIYVDDCSTDNTGTLVQQYVKEAGMGHNVQIFSNKERRGALANLYYAINSCANSEVCLIVDGDDFLKHDQVFATINRAYQDPNVWMTYGQLESNVSDYGDGYCKPMPESVIGSNGYREYQWITSHLRTFYAGLFKKIKQQDLMLENSFFHVTYDLAIMFPMLEMAAGRWQFIPDVLYVYNEQNPLNDFRVRVLEQLKCEKIIRGRKKYEPLPFLFDYHTITSDAKKRSSDSDRSTNYAPVGQRIIKSSWVPIDFDVAMQTTKYSRAIEITKQVTGVDGTAFLDLCRNLYTRYNPGVKPAGDSLKIPKIIHQIWIGGPVPQAFEAYMKSWTDKHMGPEWTYILWQDKDIEALNLYNRSYYEMIENPAAKSDIARWEIIYRFGGVYVDMDYESLKPLDELHYIYDFYTALQPLDTQYAQLGAALFGARAGHPILKHCIDTIKDDWHLHGIPARTGPIHFTKSFYQMAGCNESVDIAFPAYYFYPLECMQRELKRQEWVSKGAYAVHHWAKSWMPAQYRLKEFKQLNNDKTVAHWND